MASEWRRALSTFLIVMSTILQVIAIFVPGWMVDVIASLEVYDSLFHRRTCDVLGDNSKCETMSFKEIYDNSRRINVQAGAGNIGIATLDYDYHQVVLKQVLVIACLAATLTLVATQLLRHCNKYRHYHRLVTWTAVLGTVPVGIMISVICRQFVDISYMIKLRSFDSRRENSYIGFPYSLALYIAATTTLFLGIVVLTNQSAGPAKERAVKRPNYDDRDDVRSPVKAEFVPVHETPVAVTKTPVQDKPAISIIQVDKPKPAVDTNNSVYYSEKL